MEVCKSENVEITENGITLCPNLPWRVVIGESLSLHGPQTLLNQL